MDTQQHELSVDSKVENVTVERVLVATDINGEAVKVEKIVKENVTIIPMQQQQQQQQPPPPQQHQIHHQHQQAASPPITVHEAIVSSAAPPPPPPTTVIATRQRMITTQGHIREIAVGQASNEVSEQYEQFQITASGDGQNVYTYESSPGGIITINQPENLLKRDILIADKEHSINVVTAEPQTVYVELKNNSDEQTRFLPNATIRYEAPERYHHHHHRFAYHGLPPHNTHLQREVTLKADNQPPAQEMHEIYEAEQAQNQHHQQQQQQQQNNDSNSIQSATEQQQQQGGETKVHYTNLETVGSSQSSYYIASESYQPTNSNGFTYLPTTTSKEGPYIYHPSSPSVLYKGEFVELFYKIN